MAYDTTTYQIVDTINTQSPSATQYNSNESGGVITPDNYTAAAAHTPGALLDDGMSQKTLYEILLQLQVKWDGAMTAFDGDAGINTATFAAGCALGSLAGTYGIFPNGIDQADLVTFLTAVATKFAACTALLDADDTLTDTNYASTLDFTLDTTAIQGTGISQGAIATFLNNAITSINALWTKIDADIAA